MSLFTVLSLKSSSSRSPDQDHSKLIKHVASASIFAVVIGASMISASPSMASELSTAGNPGIVQPPRTLFSEDFENNAQWASVPLTSYVGSSPLFETYAADAPWLDAGACNGIISSGNGGDPSLCSVPGLVKTLDTMIGVVQGRTNPGSNHAVAAATNADPGADLIQFETGKPIPLSASNRFLTFSVAAAAQNCWAGNQPQLKFYLVSGGLEYPTFSTPINPCQTPGGAGIYFGNKAVLFSGSSLGIRMRNGQGNGYGNDGAFDDIRVQDVTPQLDQSFSPTAMIEGKISTLTFTVTNTSELGEKDNFSFTDNLPAGLFVVNSASSSTCGKASSMPSGGASSFALSGTLALGQATCTFSVPIIAKSGGSYINAASAITTVGLNNPGSAVITAVVAPVIHPVISIEDIAKAAADAAAIAQKKADAAAAQAAADAATAKAAADAAAVQAAAVQAAIDAQVQAAANAAAQAHAAADAATAKAVADAAAAASAQQKVDDAAAKAIVDAQVRAAAQAQAAADASAAKAAADAAAYAAAIAKKKADAAAAQATIDAQAKAAADAAARAQADADAATAKAVAAAAAAAAAQQRADEAAAKAIVDAQVQAAAQAQAAADASAAKAAADAAAYAAAVQKAEAAAAQAVLDAQIQAAANAAAVVQAAVDHAAAIFTSFGKSGEYSVLADAAITAPGSKIISGHVGSGAALTTDGGTEIGDGVAQSSSDTAIALGDLSNGYEQLRGMAATTLAVADLGNKTLHAGVYHSDAALAVTGNLTFDAQGDPNAVFIIQSDAAINTTAGTKMFLTGGAKASNIYWVSAAATTLGAASVFAGTIVSNAAITVGASSTVYGHLFSVTAAVTLDADTIDISLVGGLFI